MDSADGRTDRHEDAVIFMHSLDAIAIRSRAAIMSDFARRYTTSDGSVTRWTSIACGAAIPVLDAVEKHVGTAAVQLKLIDFDPNALDHARDKAVDRGLVEAEQFELLKRNVVKDLIVSDNLVRELGAESQQFVDMLGIFEYIADEFDGFKSAAAFLANAFQLVKPGGALVAARCSTLVPGCISSSADSDGRGYSHGPSIRSTPSSPTRVSIRHRSP